MHGKVKFAAAVAIQDYVPVMTWKIDLEGERSYKAWDKTILDGADDRACQTNALHRFFKVMAEMK